MSDSTTVKIPGAADIVVDGLNVAYWCGAPPDLRLPLALLAHLLARHRCVQLYFDASARYKLDDDDRPIYDELLQSEHVIQVPRGKHADGFMLKHARDCGGRIVSRDRFADHRRRFRKLIDDPARILSGAASGDALHVPGLGVSVPLSSTSRDAWMLVQARTTTVAADFSP